MKNQHPRNIDLSIYERSLSDDDGSLMAFQNMADVANDTVTRQVMSVSKTQEFFHSLRKVALVKKGAIRKYEQAIHEVNAVFIEIAATPDLDSEFLKCLLADNTNPIPLLNASAIAVEEGRLSPIHAQALTNVQIDPDFIVSREDVIEAIDKLKAAIEIGHKGTVTDSKTQTEDINSVLASLFQ